MKNFIKTILILLTLLGAQIAAQAANLIRTVSVSVQAGGECTVEVQVENSDAFVAFQADIPIPAGLSYVAGSAVLIPARSSGHTISASMVDNTLRLLAYSGSNTAFPGTSGTLLTFKLKAGTVPGNYPLSLTNTLLGNNLSQPLAHTTQNGSVTIQGPNFQGSASSLDFGRVALTTASTQYVTVSNTGNQNLVVSGITFTDAQFTSPDAGGFTLSAGQSRQVSVIFAPTIKGTYNKQMRILSNDPDTPEAVIALQSIGFAVNELHTGSITAASGNVASLELTLNNMEPFTSFQFDLILPAPMAFKQGSALLSRSQDHSVHANMISDNVLRVVAFSVSGKVFTGNNGKILTLDFDINGTGGWYWIELNQVIIANSGDENIVSAFTGNSLQITAPDIDANSAVNFGDVSVISSGHQNLQVYNYGQEPLIISQLNFNSGFFTSSQILPVTIQSGSSHNLPIEFIKNTKGSATGKLHIFSNDPDENPFVVNLAGNAFVPNNIIVNNISGLQGSTIDISVEINNLETFVAFQFDLEFNSGLATNLAGVQLSTRKQDHSVATTLMGNNAVRVVAYSGSQKSFTGTSGVVVTIPFDIPVDMPPGNYSLTLKNGLLSNAQSENILYGMQHGDLTVNSSTTETEQLIPLISGWNIISINVWPDNPDLLSVFQSFIDIGILRKVMDESGKAIEDYGFFGGWQNDIGNLNNSRGYKVYVTAPATLSVSGPLATLPAQVSLKAGWNIIGFPANTAQDAMAVLQPLINDGVLVKVMDESGKAIEDYGFFGGWQNDIGNLTPGKGYKVLVTANSTLTIGDADKKSATIVPELTASSYFRPVFQGNGTDHANINLVDLTKSGLMEGDEIGIFDGNLCVGSARLTSANMAQNRISIPASANDGLESSPNGFTSGNPVAVKLYRNGEESALTLTRISPDPTLSFNPSPSPSAKHALTFNLSPLTFLENGSLFATAQTGLSTGVEEWKNDPIVRCYPNPFSDFIQIEITMPPGESVTVEIFDLLSKKVRHIYTGKTNGYLTVQWNGNDGTGRKVAPGVYICKVNSIHFKVVLNQGN